MNEWCDFQLGEVATFRKGINYTSSDYGDQDSGRPFITIKCFIKGGGYESTGLKYIRGDFKEQDQLSPGDILFSVTDLTRAGDIVGSPLQVPFFGDDTYSVASMDCMRIEPDNSICSKDFLYHRMMLPDVRRQMVAYSAGSTVLHLDTKQVPRIVCRLPIDISIQRKIARILQTIDRTIEQTELLIDKYQQIKAGLMHDLFTRGIGPDGQLRPPREQAPHLYHKTRIGWIPKEWTIKSCSDVCSRICVGIVIQPTQYYVESGVPAFRSANVRESGVDPSNLVYISPASNQLLSKSQVKAGDIVSVRTGYPGTSAVVPNEFEGANCIDILISTPTKEVIPEFLCNWINSSFGKEQVLRQQGGMAQQHFNVGEMRQLLVVIPSTNEQRRISRKLNACANRILGEEKNLRKLIKQKNGLMHDLLTGKVAVALDPETTHD